ncbi:hypothetical protein BCV70DRAFT_206143 [Testicularia cyperi]|uniref:Uncharacterized protein n=1 Tax=Testicularia cyperi TaxID=1882483 RepID=A0A317XTU8_9BASI|nr:hypothetical protein BCV70DRAFT_206143 [Testicularia cyperi]
MDDWGPSSVPQVSQSNVPWDEQVVPALRKKLEQESQSLSKRISRIEESDQGWAASAIRSRESLDHRDVRATYVRNPQEASKRQSRDLVHSRPESSLDQYHNRFHHIRASSRQDDLAYQTDDNGSSTQQQYDSHHVTTSTNGANPGRGRVLSSLDRNASLSSSAYSQHQTSSPASRTSALTNDATTRAREKARQIAARQRQASQQHQQQENTKQSSGLGLGPQTHAGNGMVSNDRSWQPSYDDEQSSVTAVDSSYGTPSDMRTQQHRSQSKHNGSSQQEFPGDKSQASHQPQGPSTEFRSQRLRTQSTPLRPSIDHGANGGMLATPDASLHKRTPSSARRKAAAAASMDPKLIEEFGPLGSSASPSSSLRRAHLQLHPEQTESPNGTRTTRPAQPDAFLSLSPDNRMARSVREGSAPAAMGNGGGQMSEFGVPSPSSKSVNDWEEQIIPTVARRLQQQQMLADDSRLSRYEGLIDRWDKDGLPLSKNDDIARRKAEKERLERAAEEQAARQRQREQEKARAQAHAEAEAEAEAQRRREQEQLKQSTLSPDHAGTFDRQSSRSNRSFTEDTMNNNGPLSSSQDVAMQNTSSRRPSHASQAGSYQSRHHPQKPWQSQQAQYPPSHTQPAATPRPATQQTVQPSQQHSKKQAKQANDAGSCCCIVM